MKNNMNDQSLGEALRDEAKSQSPAFSDDLHRTIMRSIESAKAPAPTNYFDFRRLILGVSIAAMVIVGVFVEYRYRMSEPAPRPNQWVNTPPVPTVGPIASYANPGAERIDQARYAYLDKDAARLTHYMLDQMDVFPTTK